MRPNVQRQSHIRDNEERARGKWYGATFVVGVEHRLGGLLPERGPGAERAADEVEFGGRERYGASGGKGEFAYNVDALEEGVQ